MTEVRDLQGPFLQKLVKDKVPVSVFLVNGIKLQGHIDDYDDTVIVLANNIRQMVFKHAISTVVPSIKIE